MIREILTEIVGSPEAADDIILGLSRRGYRVLPKAPTPEMVEAGTRHRTNSEIGRVNTWAADTTTLYWTMLEASPK
jgi:hypothetical protein